MGEVLAELFVQEQRLLFVLVVIYDHSYRNVDRGGEILQWKRCAKLCWDKDLGDDKSDFVKWGD